jgi:hypothetical protein
MDSSSQAKVKQVCLRIALLMEHQEILPDLKELVAELSPEITTPILTDQYLQGAQEALNYLISFLEQKGNR